MNIQGLHAPFSLFYTGPSYSVMRTREFSHPAHGKENPERSLGFRTVTDFRHCRQAASVHIEMMSMNHTAKANLELVFMKIYLRGL